MQKTRLENLRKKRRQARVRAVISGTANRPRLTVNRSNQHLYLQAIDDERGRTLVASSTEEIEAAEKKMTKTEMAYLAGIVLAEKAEKKGIVAMVFDRRHYKYHGRVRRVVEALREKGVKI